MCIRDRDKATGKEQQIRIQASGGLSEADIQKMVKEAEAHAEEDKKRRALVEARNQAESLVHLTEKTLAEHGDKLNAADKTAVEKALSDLKSAIGGEDSGEIETRSHILTQASTKLDEAVHAASQPRTSGDQTAESQGAAGDEKVVDAEFEEVDGPKRSQR